jgi:plasmid maintenance system antidote protein VapI
VNPEFWMNLQARLELWRAIKVKGRPRIARPLVSK